MVNFINKVNLKDTIILSKRNNNQLYYLMLGELNIIKEIYKDKFNYLILEEKIFDNIFKTKTNIYPKLLIIEKDNKYININGFRHINYILNVLEKKIVI